MPFVPHFKVPDRRADGVGQKGDHMPINPFPTWPADKPLPDAETALELFPDKSRLMLTHWLEREAQKRGQWRLPMPQHQMHLPVQSRSNHNLFGMFRVLPPTVQAGMRWFPKATEGQVRSHLSRARKLREAVAA